MYKSPQSYNKNRKCGESGKFTMMIQNNILYLLLFMPINKFTCILKCLHTVSAANKTKTELYK